MNENEDKNIQQSLPENSPASEDKISLRGSAYGNKKSERKIKPTPVVHTSGKDEIHIPTGEKEEPKQEKQRFIKTNETPFVSTSAEKVPETDGKDIDKYSDRISMKAPTKKVHTGNTGKINVYTNTHAASEEDGRMIAASESETKENTAEPDVKTAPELKTKEIEYDEDGFVEIEDISDTAPTRQVDIEKGSLLREIAGTAEEGVRRNPDQLMMDGFDSIGKKDSKQIEQEQKEEAELQEELNKTRQKRINSFRFWSKQSKGETSEEENTDEKFSQAPEKKPLPNLLQKLSDRFSGLDTPFTPIESEEYTDHNKRKEIFTSLLAARKTVLFRLLIIAIIGVALFVIDIAAGISADSDVNGFFSLFGGSYTVYNTINLVLLLVSAGLMFNDLKSGLFSLLKVHPKADTSLLFMFIAAAAQNICAYFTELKLEENFRLIAPATVLLCIPYLFAKLFYYDNMRQCFKAVATKSEKSYLRRITDKSLVADVLRDREVDKQNIVYPGKTRFISNFLKRGSESAYSGMPSSRCVLITLAVSLIVGIISAIIEQNIIYGVTALAMCLAFSFPVSCLFTTGYKISSENKKLSVKSSFVHGYEDARVFSAIDNIAIRDSELFTAEITNCFTAKNVSNNQAKFCAAVLTSKFGGPLNTALMEEMSKFSEKFPTAENLVYEEKLGLSAWASNCKVLVGTHTLLVNHNVKLPDEKDVKTFLGDDENPVYIAIEGNFAAVLGVKYTCKEETAESLRELVKSGTTILLSSYDACLTESYAEELLGMPECSVRVINPAASTKLANAMENITNSEEAGIVFTDSLDSLCRCASAAIRLDRSKRTAKLVCETGTYVSLLIGAMLALTGEFSDASAFIPVLVQLIWLAICFAAPLLFKSVKLPKKAAKTEKQDALPSEENTAAEEVSEETEKTATENIAASDKKEKKAEAEEPVDEKKTKKDEEDEPGVISQATFDALDAMAEEKPKKSRKASSEDKADSKSEQNEAQTTEDATDETETEEESQVEAVENAVSDAVNKTVGKAKKIFGGILSKVTVAAPEEEEEEEDEEEENLRRKNSGKATFASTIPVRTQPNPAQNAPQEIINQAKEEARIRASFTPPKMSKAPLFDLGKKEETTPNASYTLPKDSHPEFFTDEMFSRFEDDNIFAALHEERNNSQKR